MTKSTLARPKWEIGQVLLPDHFTGLEASLSAEAAIRAELWGLPSHGVARLEWSGARPEDGVISVWGLTLVLRGGMVVDTSETGNARVKGPLDLNKAGRGKVAVHAHVLPEEDDGVEPPKATPARAIARVRYVVELGAEASVPGSLGSFELGLFEVVDKRFRLSERVVPPLLRLDTTPYLRGRLERLQAALEEFEAELDAAALAALARGESLAAVQRARIEVRKAAALLADLWSGVQLHPYVVFRALRDLALELCVLDERSAPWKPVAYLHGEPARCFGDVLEAIEARITPLLPESPCVPFELQNGRMVAEELPPAALSAPELFVAVLKASAGDEVALDHVRFASPNRLRTVNEYALRGIRPARREKAPFRHGFSGPVDFHQLTPIPGPELGYVAQEKAIAFYAEPRFEGIRFVLCWRGA